MSEKIRWGLLGLGSIARRFAAGLAFVPDAEIYAVGSRSQAKAEAFAAEFGARRAYGSYAALAADPAVDVVYVATPHTYHCPNTLLCLDAGKHVLCEKPFAVNAREAAAMIARAREKNLFLMDAFWTRFSRAWQSCANCWRKSASAMSCWCRRILAIAPGKSCPRAAPTTPIWPAAPCSMSALIACSSRLWSMASNPSR